MNENGKTIRIVLHNGKPVASANVSAPQIRIPETSSVSTAVPEFKRYQCPHCGAKLETDEAIEGMQVPCPECGAEFVVTPMQPSRDAYESSSLPLPSRTKKSRGVKWCLGGVVVCLILLVLAGGWWFMKGGDADGEKRPARATKDEPQKSTLDERASSKKKMKPKSTTLVSQPFKKHCMNFGGRVAPDLMSFSMTTDGVENQLEGNPLYFAASKRLLWSHYEVQSGEGHVFVRRDLWEEYDESQKKVFLEYTMPLAVLEVINRSSNYRFNSGTEMAQTIQNLWKGAFARSARIPAPVMFSFQKNTTRFLYVNSEGEPSALRWGVKTNDWFWCYEGAEALSDYAKCLDELKTTLIKYTEIAHEEGLQNYQKAISVSLSPEIYVGQTDQGLLESACVTYEFVVENAGKGIYIKETSKTPHIIATKRLYADDLDEELAFFSRFVTIAAIEQAFTPLYCFLSQQKILLEDAVLEAERIARRLEGKDITQDASHDKHEQHLTFAPIGQQFTTSAVPLSATADSGGKVLFSVNSGPGKITGDTLTFTSRGTVEVCARQWGNEKWHFVAVTQKVEVVAPSEPVATITRANTPSSLDLPTTQKMPQEKSVLPEYVELAGALEAAKGEGTAENYKKMMAVWTGLGAEEKAATQKSVLWAYCAMLWSKGNTAAAEKRKGAIDYRAFLQAVTDPCRACNGRGGKQETCRYCHGSGMVESGQSGSGSCPFCHGSGQVGGRLGGHPSTCPKCGGSGKSGSASGGRKTCPNCTGGTIREVCRTCGGTGRVYSESKCKRVVEENLEAALRICHGGNEAGRQRRGEEADNNTFGGWAGW